MTTKRSPVSSGKDHRIFTHTARQTKALNSLSVFVQRGGIRL